MKVKHYPLTNTARVIIVLAFVINIVALASMANYPALPNAKPAAFFVPVIFLAVSVLFALVLHFRYTLLEKYPYLLNLPSFVYRLGMEKNPSVQALVISKVFTVYSFVLLFVSIMDILITSLVLLEGSGAASAQSFLPLIFIFIGLFIVTLFLLYRHIYRSFVTRA